MTESKLPSWDLASIYPSVDSPEFNNDIERIYVLSKELKEKSRDKASPLSTC